MTKETELILTALENEGNLFLSRSKENDAQGGDPTATWLLREIGKHRLITVKTAREAISNKNPDPYTGN